jgi:hypothetical protein
MSNLGTFQNLLKNPQVEIGFNPSPRIEINLGLENDKEARDFTASVVSAYSLTTSKFTLSDKNSNLPGLDQLLKHKRRLRKLWQKTRDLACKTEITWVTKSIKQMTLKKTLERWGKK